MPDRKYNIKKTAALLEKRIAKLDGMCCGNGCQNCVRSHADILRAALDKLKQRRA